MMHTFPKDTGSGSCYEPAKFVTQDRNQMVIYCAIGHTIKVRSFDDSERARQAVERQSKTLTPVEAAG